MITHNEDIGKEYNVLKLKITAIVRGICQHREYNENSFAILELDELKTEANTTHITLNAGLLAEVAQEVILDEDGMEHLSAP